MDGVERRTARAQDVERLGDPVDVVEAEVARIVDVDVRGGHPLEQQEPAAGAAGIGDDLGDAGQRRDPYGRRPPRPAAAGAGAAHADIVADQAARAPIPSRQWASWSRAARLGAPSTAT